MRICALQIFASLALACIPMDRVAAAEDRRSHDTTADKPAFVIGVSVISTAGRKMINTNSRRQVRTISKSGRT